MPARVGRWGLKTESKMKKATLADLLPEEVTNNMIGVKSSMIKEVPICYLPLYFIHDIAIHIILFGDGEKSASFHQGRESLFLIGDAMVILAKLAIDKKLSIY